MLTWKQSTSIERVCGDTDKRESLTWMESCKENPEFALSASLIRPQPHHAHRGGQHDVIGHCGAELILQVLDRTAAVVDGNKVPLALIRVVHLIFQKTHVDLWVRGLSGINQRCSGPGFGYIYSSWLITQLFFPNFVGKFFF